MNYGTLKNLVKEYLEVDEATFNDNIAIFVRAAEEDIFRQVQLPDLMQTSTANFISGNQFLPVPSDFLSPYSLAVIVNGEYRMMLSKDHSFIREVYPGTGERGVPRFYAVYNDANFLIGPTPDDDYDVELNYFYEPPSLTSGDDSKETWLSVNAENAILFGTIIQGYIYLKGDQDVMKQYIEQYQTAIAALKILAEGRNRKDVYRNSDRRIAT